MNRSKRSYPKRPTGRNYKKAVLLLALVAIALLAIGYFRLYGNSTNQTAQDTSAARKAQAKDEAQKKKQVVEDNQTNDKTTPRGSASAPTDSGQAITALSAKQEANGSVTVFTKLASETEGNCVLTVRNNGKTVTKNADIIFQPEFSTCAGYSLPVSQLGGGQWVITLSAGGSVKSISLQVAT